MKGKRKGGRERERKTEREKKTLLTERKHYLFFHRSYIMISCFQALLPSFLLSHFKTFYRLKIKGKYKNGNTLRIYEFMINVGNGVFMRTL